MVWAYDGKGTSILNVKMEVYWIGLSLYCISRILKERIAQALLRRRNHKDTFRDTYGYSWDAMIVFKVYDEGDLISTEQIEYNMKYILNQLACGGLEVRLFYSTMVSKCQSYNIISDV